MRVLSKEELEPEGLPPPPPLPAAPRPEGPHVPPETHPWKSGPAPGGLPKPKRTGGGRASRTGRCSRCRKVAWLLKTTEPTACAACHRIASPWESKPKGSRRP